MTSTSRQDESPTTPTIQRISTIRSAQTVLSMDNKPAFKPDRQFLLAFTALCILGLTSAMDATSLSVALPTISTALGATALQAFWSGTSFLLASTVLQPTVASLSNIFGRKQLIYTTSAFFAAGSLTAALANTPGVLLAGRTAQGVGGGGILALTEVVMTDLVPLTARGRWSSVMSAFWSVGTVAGPLVGAGFAQSTGTGAAAGWRWIFYVNLPLVAAGVLLVALFLRQAPVPGAVAPKLARFDWLGSALFTVSLTAFLFGLTTGGVMYGWGSWRVLLPLLAGLVGVVVFGVWEFRYAKEPIVNKGIFNNWDMIASYIMTVFHGMILWSLLYFLVLYYQAVKLFTPVLSAVAALPETLTVAPAAIAAGLAASRTGRYRWSLWAGWLLTTAGAGLLLALGPGTPAAAWVWLNLPVGAGAGILFPALALSVQAASPPALSGDAAAFFSFARDLGQAAGVAASGVVFQNVFRRRLLALPGLDPGVADGYARDAMAVVGVIQRMGPGPRRDEIVGAFNGGLQAIYVSMVVFGGFCLLLGASIRGYTLQQEHVTKQGLLRKSANFEEECGDVEL